MKQTAVKQIINEFNKELDVAISIANNDKIKTIKHLIHIASNYLEMEKDQIIKHSLELAKILISNPYERSGKMPTELVEQYYNETFKSE